MLYIASSIPHLMTSRHEDGFHINVLCEGSLPLTGGHWKRNGALMTPLWWYAGVQHNFVPLWVGILIMLYLYCSFLIGLRQTMSRYAGMRFNGSKHSATIYEDFGTRSRYLGQGKVIASHRIQWDAITYACLRFPLLAPKSSYNDDNTDNHQTLFVCRLFTITMLPT